MYDSVLIAAAYATYGACWLATQMRYHDARTIDPSCIYVSKVEQAAGEPK